MTPEEVTLLAMQAKGNPALMLSLWDAVRRLIALWANQYIHNAHEQGNRLFDTDDLIQSGYLALVDAVAGYDPEAGAEFTTYLHYHVRKHFTEVSGHRGTKRRPEVDAVSLDEPLNVDGDVSRRDLLADSSAEFADDIIEREATARDCAALMAEIEKLPEERRNALMLTAWEGKTCQAAAEALGVTYGVLQQRKTEGIRQVRRTKAARQIEADYIRIRHVTLSEFLTTGTREVEWALWL